MGCANANTVGRKNVGTGGTWSAGNSTCLSAQNSFGSYAGCPSSNLDYAHRVFMRKGETLHITLTLGNPCYWAGPWSMVFKIYSGAACAESTTCSNPVGCWTPSTSPWTHDFVAPADRWYTLVIDGTNAILSGSGADNGSYGLPLKLDCNQANCEC